MHGLFTRIRWRLVGWTMLILGLILVLLGTTVYVALSRSLTQEVDRNLVLSSQQALPAFLGPSDQPGRPNNGRPPPGPQRAGAGQPPAGQHHRRDLASAHR